MDDDTVVLLALDADSRGLFPPGALDRSKWNLIVSASDVLKSEHWLLAYEAHHQGWLNCPSVANDPAFTGMRAAGVSFYDGTKNVPQYPAAAGPLAGGEVPDNYA
jgi:hypothetical protein